MGMTSECTDPALVREARAWIAECEWADLDADDIADLTDAQVRSGVERCYEGGWAEFVAVSL